KRTGKIQKCTQGDGRLCPEIQDFNRLDSVFLLQGAGKQQVRSRKRNRQEQATTDRAVGLSFAFRHLAASPAAQASVSGSASSHRRNQLFQSIIRRPAPYFPRPLA